MRKSDIVILLVASELSPAVSAEITTCMDRGLPLLTFRLPVDYTDPDTQVLLESTKEYGIWEKVTYPDHLARHIRESLEIQSEPPCLRRGKL